MVSWLVGFHLRRVTFFTFNVSLSFYFFVSTTNPYVLLIQTPPSCECTVPSALAGDMSDHAMRPIVQHLGRISRMCSVQV